ncbi:MAG: hypothetical protein LKJ21_00190 [Oscillospiraceae bacterium]|nr:hypothetical protein [Oscillospiraceae bacterium]MCI1989888.1 hypothetical protein [Oscillospiraceae bacterium]MCI2035061.1 hypothetical protein [Oscillospiraceae bacterium]
MKLPLCPYCGARFLYPDVKRSMGAKTGTCPHCGKRFRISAGRGLAALLPAALLVLFGVDWFLLCIPDMNLLYLLAVTAAGVAAAYFLIPYTVRYRPL